jgi:uncharacterized membrane protein
MRMNSMLAFAGMITGVFGALLIALNIGMFLQGYILFMISSLTWVMYALRTSQKNLLILNIVFSAVNLIGLINFG